ncbi:MAG: Gfo/Idh/MocA family oxidoreductase [Planctomycetota bacterium]|nr:Gfo/Idh/MocA family oxidoreductase [Planctomycetota bacterium]
MSIPKKALGPDAPIRIGIIGAGGISAKMHLPQLDGLQGVSVAALGGRNLRRLETLARRHGGKPVTDYAAIVEDPNLEAIIVATPHPHHVEWGLKALQAGKHLFMQKPLAPTLDEANRFVEAAEASDRIVYCLPQQNVPVVLAIRELIAAGRLGKLSGAHARHSHGGPEVYYAEVRDLLGEPPLKPGEKLWFFEAGEAAVGALFDMGVYSVARLVGVLGSARRVIGMTGILDKPSEVEDTATLLIQFANGAIGTAETGWCDGARTSRLCVHGTRGRVENLAFHASALTLFEQASTTREDIPPTRTEVDISRHKGQNPHEQFVEAIRTGKPPLFETARAARHITEILLAGIESARSGRVVELKTSVA